MEWCLGGRALLGKKESLALKGKWQSTVWEEGSHGPPQFSSISHDGVIFLLSPFWSPTIPDLPIPGTSSDSSGVWVEDSVEKEGETRKGIWCRRGLGLVWRLKSVFRTDMHRARVHLFKASGLPFHLLAFTAVGDFTLGKGSLLMIF